MGLGSYFKADKPAASSPTSSPSTPAAVSSSGKLSAPQPSHLRPSGRSPSSNGEKSGADGGNDYELQPPSTRFNSRPASLSARSYRSNNSSLIVEDIKHEVMVNYMYQQQCSQLWVSDGSGEVEGVLLRKSKGHYMACPPQLGTSPFAVACAALNVQV